MLCFFPQATDPFKAMAKLEKAVESVMSDKQRIEVFFDGACPICSREMAMVRKLDRSQTIHCVDIASGDFDAIKEGLDVDAVSRHIHGRLGDGSIVTGVEVFRQVYGLLGFRRWVDWSRRPWVAKVLDDAYAIFAKYRQKISQPFRWTFRLR